MKVYARRSKHCWFCEHGTAQITDVTRRDDDEECEDGTITVKWDHLDGFPSDEEEELHWSEFVAAHCRCDPSKHGARIYTSSCHSVIPCGWKDDLWYYLCNNHPLLSQIFVDDDHPLDKHERRVTELVGVGFTLLMSSTAVYTFAMVTIPSIILDKVMFYMLACPCALEEVTHEDYKPDRCKKILNDLERHALAMLVVLAACCWGGAFIILMPQLFWWLGLSSTSWVKNHG
eukprot:gene57497-biopygen32256